MPARTPLATGDAGLFGALRAHLAESRSMGMAFGEAWARAADDGVLPHRAGNSGGILVCQRDVIESTRGAWERAFNHQPPAPAERAVVQLAAVLIAEPGERYADDVPAW